MAERLESAASPYLRAHARNPVDWWPWGAEPFAEAAARDVPVLVSIGYATCHWCHVMARESFEDPDLAAFLNEHFVAVKVDREEHPEVDSAYLAAAAAFTPHLGWPLTVFATPAGRAFYAGTYFPPVPSGGRPAFREMLEAVLEAWRDRRSEVEANGAAIAAALAAAPRSEAAALPDAEGPAAAVALLARQEDREHGGFGTGAKFPVAPVLRFLAEAGQAGDAAAGRLGGRVLDRIADRLADPFDGGVYRYATRRDWSQPHYERMLYDNAQLLAVAALSSRELSSRERLADRIAGYLLGTLRQPGGAFASAQDSESDLDGRRVEGGWHLLDPERRGEAPPPEIDEKILTGWNGLAIEALALAASRFERDEWAEAARATADWLLARHVEADGLRRMSVDGSPSDAPATLEDYGLLAVGLLELARTTGIPGYAVQARRLVDACLAAGEPFGLPTGGDPVLAAQGLGGQGLGGQSERADNALPSGWSALAAAAERLAGLTVDPRYRAAAEQAMAAVAEEAMRQPIAHGAALAVIRRLAAPPRQLVVVADGGDPGLAALARRTGGSVVTPAKAADWARQGFDLYEGRTTEPGVTTAYLCEGFVCRLPVTTAPALEELLSGDRMTGPEGRPDRKG